MTKTGLDLSNLGHFDFSKLECSFFKIMVIHGFGILNFGHCNLFVI